MLDKLGKAQADIALLGDKNAELQRVLDNERLVYKKEQQSLEAKIVEMTTTAANFHSIVVSCDSLAPPTSFYHHRVSRARVA